jgi:hypothetical protein
MNGECVKLLDYLRGQLPCRSQNEGACPASRLSEEPMQNRKEKCGGLSASRGSACKDVATFECRGNCIRLNWSGASESELLDTTEEIAVEMKD